MPALFQRVFKAFSYPDFRTMWIGACVSTIGTWMQSTAQSWLVLEISRNPFYLGLDAFLGQIPIFLFTLVGGVAADRVDRRHILIASQVTQMACAIVLATLFLLEVVRIEHILGLSFIVGTAQAFGGPAYSALIPTLVAREDMPNAIAMNSIQFNLARMIGPAIGLLAMTKLGAAWCFYLNGLSYVAVIFTLLIVKSRFIPAVNRVSVVESIKQGLLFIHHKAAMKSLIVIAFLMTMLGVPLLTFLPVFAKDSFQRDVGGYTVLLEVAGGGAIVGAILVAGFHQGRSKGRWALINLILLGVTTVIFAWTTHFWIGCAVLFIGSALLISVFALINSVVQESASEEMRGRVMSVYNMAFRGGMPFGSLFSGKLVEGYGAPLVVACNGLLLSLLGVYYLLARKKVSAL